MKIIESVLTGRFSSCVFFVRCFFQFTLLTLGIQLADIGKIFDTFILPAREDLVCIGEAGLTGCQNRTAAGFLDNVQCETIILQPGAIREISFSTGFGR